MKRHFCQALVLATLLLPACSSQDTPEPRALRQPNPIAFQVPFVGKQGITRTTYTGDITNSNITEFRAQLFALRYTNVWNEAPTPSMPAPLWIFDNPRTPEKNDGAELYTNAFTKKWSYSNTKYWDPGFKYDFTAIIPGDSEGIFEYEYNGGLWNVFNIAVVQTAKPNGSSSERGADILVAPVTTTTEEESGTSGVSLTMHHLLSRFTTYVICSPELEEKVKIKDLFFCLPANKKGHYMQDSHSDPENPLAGEWTWDFAVPSQDFATPEEALAGGSGYKQYTLLKDQYLAVPANASISVANALKVGYSFFITPTPQDAVMPVYMGITYDVAYGSSSVRRTQFHRVQALGKFKQGFQHNLIINISDDQPITFAVESIKDWDIEDARADVKEVEE